MRERESERVRVSVRFRESEHLRARLRKHRLLRLPRNLHTKCCACHEIYTSRFTKCCACQGVCTSRLTKCCPCHEICTSRFTWRSPANLSRKLKSTLDHQSTRFPLPATKSDHHAKKRCTPPLRSRDEHPPRPTRFREACAVEMHFEDFERHECTVNIATN